MIYSYQSEIKNLEEKIQTLKEKQLKERENFLPLLENFLDGQIKSWGLELNLAKNKLVKVSNLFYGEIKPYLFSSSAVPFMKDFWFLAREDFNYHTRDERTDYFLIPFYQHDNHIIFADFEMLFIHEYDVWGAKKGEPGLSKLIHSLKEKKLSSNIVEKLIQIIKNDVR